MFLLDGEVCSRLADFRSKLKSTPASVIKSWSSMNNKVLRFKRALITKQIHNRQALIDQWNSDPHCKFTPVSRTLISLLIFRFFLVLLEEYQNLLYDVALSELTPLWPPVDKKEPQRQ